MENEQKKVDLSIDIDKASTKKLPHGVIEVIVSTGKKDYHREEIKMDGLNLKEYHGVVLYGHDYGSLPIAKTLKIWKDKVIDGVRARMQFAIEENPFAKTVYDLVMGGYLTDVSIGGIVDQWNEDYTVIEKMTMKEFSVVPIGANEQAQIVASGFGKSLKDIRKEYEVAVEKFMHDKVKTIPKAEMADAIKSMKIILTALEGEVEAISNETVPSVSRTKLVVLKQGAKELDRHSETIIKTVKYIKKGQ